jgi:hypothetical protein
MVTLPPVLASINFTRISLPSIAVAIGKVMVILAPTTAGLASITLSFDDIVYLVWNLVLIDVISLTPLNACHPMFEPLLSRAVST